MNGPSDPQFVRGIEANLTYWQAYLDGKPDGPSFSLEHSNLVLAVKFGLILPDTYTTAVKLAVQAYPLIERHGYWRTWIRLLQQALKNGCQDEETALLQAKLHNICGQLYRRTHQLEAALAAHEEAARIAQRYGNQENILEVQFNLSDDYRLLRQYNQAEALGLAALDVANRVAGALKWRASILNTLGLLAWEQGQLSLAQTRLEEATHLWRDIDSRTELARTLNNLATVLAEENHTETALELFQEASNLLRATGYELDKCRIQLSLGTLYFNQEQYEEAEAAFRQADSLALRQSGDNALRGLQAHNLGICLQHQGRYTEAEIHLRRGLMLCREVDDRLMMANTMGTLAEVVAVLQQAEVACTFYDEALVLLSEFDNAMARRLQKEFSRKRSLLAKA